MAGAWAWPWLRAGPTSCLLATVALALIALGGRAARTAWLAIAAAGFTLGLSAAALQQRGDRIEAGADPSPLIGTVTRVIGAELFMTTPTGPVRLCCVADVRVGDRVVAWTRPWRRPALLPGAARDRSDDLRAGRRPLRARRARVLAGRRPRDDPFAAARHRGLLRALALGDRAGVDRDTRALLRRTGTGHLLAISGLHVGLLASAVGGLAWLLCRPLTLGRHWRLSALIPAITAATASVAYATAVGAPASARRAAVMVVAAAGTAALGRRPRAATLLGLAAAGLTLGDPGVVGDLGFQLSFSAVIGVLLVVPRFTRLLPPDSGRGSTWLLRSVATTCGATAGTLPIVAWRFQQLAPLSPLANLFAAPLVGGVVVPGALLVSVLPPGIARPPLWICDHSLDLVLWLLHLLDRDPWSPAVGPAGALLLTATLLLRRRTAAAALLGVVALGLRAVPASRLTVTFLSVGQGDAGLVEWPDGRRWLIDGGPRRQDVLTYLRRRGIRHLDALVLSHPHPDHSTGLLGVAEAIDFDALWLPRRPRRPADDDWSLWLRAAESGATVHLADDPPPPGVRVEHPRAGWRATGRDAVNEESLVLRFTLGSCSALFTGDIEEDAEELLARTLAPVTVIKVPHHGSRSSSTDRLVSAAAPAVAVISAGSGNPYGHPHAGTLARWLLPGRVPATRRARPPPPPRTPCAGDATHGGASCRTRLLRTDRDGTVEWSTDGVTWRLRAWRADLGWHTLVSGAMGS